MKQAELKQLSLADLNQKIEELQEELFNLRFQRAAGRMENPMRFRQVKRNIARVKTEISLRNKAAGGVGGEA